jgi:hypothetical protein
MGRKGGLKGGRWLTVEISGVKWGINTEVCAQSLLKWLKSFYLFKKWGRGFKCFSAPINPASMKKDE